MPKHGTVPASKRFTLQIVCTETVSTICGVYRYYVASVRRAIVKIHGVFIGTTSWMATGRETFIFLRHPRKTGALSVVRGQKVK